MRNGDFFLKNRWSIEREKSESAKEKGIQVKANQVSRLNEVKSSDENSREQKAELECSDMISVTVTIFLPFLLLLQTKLWPPPGRAGRTVVAPSIIGTAFYQKAKLFSNDKVK